jgi:hypothetical protein
MRMLRGFMPLARPRKAGRGARDAGRGRRHRQAVLGLGIAAIVAASGCATMETAIVAEPGVAFDLPLGKTAALSGNGVRITFREVREDSRCPTDVTCVWEGDAKIELTISRNGAPDDVKVISLSPINNETSSGDLRIRFVRLDPVPRQADAGKPRAYVAQLVVNRS